MKLGQSGTTPQSAIAWKAPPRVAEIVRPRYVTRQPTGTRSRSRGVPHGISGLAPSCPIWLWATLFPVPLRPLLLVRRAPFRRPLSPEIQLPADAALALMGPNSGGPGQASRFHATRRGIRQLAAAGELCHPPDATQVRVAIRTQNPCCIFAVSGLCPYIESWYSGHGPGCWVTVCLLLTVVATSAAR